MSFMDFNLTILECTATPTSQDGSGKVRTGWKGLEKSVSLLGGGRLF